MAIAATWSEVPLDLIHLLARSSTLDLDDLVRLGAVCKSSRSILNESQCFGNRQQWEALSVTHLHLPKLMLAENDASDDTRDFFDLATGRTFQLHLPEARQRYICGSNDGWLVTMAEGMENHLLNPITRRRIRLPSQLPFQDFDRRDTNEKLHGLIASMQWLERFIDKAVIVGSPCSAGGCIVAAIVFPDDGSRVAAVIRP